MKFYRFKTDNDTRIIVLEPGKYIICIFLEETSLRVEYKITAKISNKTNHFQEISLKEIKDELSHTIDVLFSSNMVYINQHDRNTFRTGLYSYYISSDNVLGVIIIEDILIRKKIDEFYVNFNKFSMGSAILNHRIHKPTRIENYYKHFFKITDNLIFKIRDEISKMVE